MSNCLHKLNGIVKFILFHPNTYFITILIVTSLTSSHAQNTWTQKADFGGGERSGAVGFSIGSKGYIGTGIDGIYKNDFWEYDPEINTWSQKADFGGTARTSAVGFSIGSRGYVGTGGQTSSYKNDFWEYDPVTNTWTQKANFGGTARVGAVGFSMGSKGYIGTGYDGFYKSDFWEYEPVTDSWTKKADFGGIARYYAVGFSIGSKGYLGTGSDGNPKKDFWEYDPTSNTWTQKADIGGGARYNGIGLSIGSKGYIGTGWGGFIKDDFWEYEPVINGWTKKADFGGSPRYYAAGFSIGNKGYIGTGENFFIGTVFNDFWEYTPDEELACNIPTSLSTINITPSTAKLLWDTVSGAVGYKIRYKISGTSEWTTIRSADNDKILSGLTPSTEYAWQVKSICNTQPIVSSDWSEKQFFITDALRLAAINETMFEVYPNPVSQSATVSFSLNERSPVLIEIMDVNGKLLRVIANQDFSAGSHEVTFDRESLIAGIYFLQLKTNEGVMMRKVIIE